MNTRSRGRAPRHRLDHIAASIQDPELSVAAVAQRQGISPRYLQRLLESSGSSFTARVDGLRLQGALRC